MGFYYIDEKHGLDDGLGWDTFLQFALAEGFFCTNMR